MAHRVPEPSRGTFAALRATQTSHRLVNDIVYHSTPELEALKVKPPPPLPLRLWECVRMAAGHLIPRATLGEWVILWVFCVLTAAMIVAFIAAA